MARYYEELTPSLKFPDRVSIYRVTGSINRTWTMRVRKAKGGYITRSLKTSNKAEAILKADDFFMHFSVNEQKGVFFTDARFMDQFSRWLNSGELSEQRHKRIKSVYSRYFAAFYKNIPIDQITDQLHASYLRWRVAYWTEYEKGNLDSLYLDPTYTPKYEGAIYHRSKTPSITTLKGETQILKQFLYWTKSKRLLGIVPRLKMQRAYSEVAKHQAKDSRRRAKSLPRKGPVSNLAITRKLRALMEEPETNWIRKFGRARLYYFIKICQWSLIRPTMEATMLRWGDIQYIKSKEHGLTLALIRVTHPKTGKPWTPDDGRWAVMPYGAVRYLVEWHQLSRSYGEQFGKPTDYVFPNWKGEHCEAHIMGRLFRDKLLLWNKHRLSDGRVITLYSMARHTAIRDRIVNSKWTIQQVAQAAGTSIFQISNFYAEDFIEAYPEVWADTWIHSNPKLKPEQKKFIEDGVAEIRNYYTDVEVPEDDDGGDWTVSSDA